MKTDGSDRAEKSRGDGKLVRSPVQVLKELVSTDYVKGRFKEVMGEKAPAFIASIMNATQKNPELARCEPQSILSSAMVAATLDLPIDSNLGFSAIVPYNTKRKDLQTGQEYWTPVAQFQIMYKGFIQLALRSGQYRKINISPVYEDEFESYDIITGDVIIHPVEGGYREKEVDEKIVGYAAFFRLLNGYERVDYWPLKKIKAHGEKYSKSYKHPNSLWKKDPHVMYAKTVLKNTLSRWGILSVSMQTAIIADQAVIREFDKPIEGDNVNYVDNPDGEEVSVEPVEWQTVDSNVPPAEEKKPERESAAKQGPVKDAVAQTSEADASAVITESSLPANGKPGKTGKGLFSEDEEQALEELYERQQSGPDFGD